MKIIAAVIVLVCGGLLILGTVDFPFWGDPNSPAMLYLSPHYIEEAERETATPNIVTAVLGDYRGFDTMFETAVIFCAAVACFFLLRQFTFKTSQARLFRHIPTGITLRIEEGGKTPEGSAEFQRIDSEWVPYDLIVKWTCRLLVPFIQIFALYVIAHGHHSPGGGFQGGVMLGAALILYALSHDLRSTLKRMNEPMATFFCTAGVAIFAGTGGLCLLFGANFLDYGALADILGVGPVMAHSLGILIVEIGVGIAVMAVMVYLYYNLSSAGKLDEGL